MIDYTIYSNPDDRILLRAKKHIEDGNLICFPTDTNWIVACSAFDKKAIDKLYQFKNVSKSKHFSVLCPNISKASEIAQISDHAFRLIKPLIPGNYTFVFNATPKICKVIKASKTDKEIGIRFTPCTFAQKLLNFCDQQLISTNITQEMIKIEEDEVIYSILIDDLYSHQLAMIIDPGDVEFVGLSTIIDFTQNDTPVVLRAGAGPVHHFGL